MSVNKRVGIIANPASGKDIRRLVAQGSVFDNNEKVNIIRRVLLGLEATGLTDVLYMPDYYHSIEKAINAIKLSFTPRQLDMDMLGTQADSTLAGQLMAEAGVACIITLGGDGTNRAVVKGNSSVPILPISTGTNNVFPFMVEGTLAGIAAGFFAQGIVPVEDVAQKTNRLDILIDGKFADLALVDIAVSDDAFIGSRAIWDIHKVREIFLSRAMASTMGLSAVGGALNCRKMDRQYGMHIILADAEDDLSMEVVAPIAPGLVSKVKIQQFSLLEDGSEIRINHIPSVLALDGEREIEVGINDEVIIRFSRQGPLVINVNRALQVASQANFFISHADLMSQSPCILQQLGLCKTPCD